MCIYFFEFQDLIGIVKENCNCITLQDDLLDEWTIMLQQHEGFRESQHGAFVGRKNLIKQCHQTLNEMGQTGGLLGVVGKPGSGKTALMVSSEIVVGIKFIYLKVFFSECSFSQFIFH